MPLLAMLPPARQGAPGQALEAMDAQLRATGFRLRAALPAKAPAPAELVVVAIDAESLDQAQWSSTEERRASPLLAAMGPWPWPRALQADLAAWVLERGARRVLFNVVMSEPSRFGPADDRAFRERLRPWRGQVVLAASYHLRESEDLQVGQLRRPSPGVSPASSLAPGLTTLLQSPQGYTEAIPGATWLRAQLGGFSPPLPRPLPDLARSNPDGPPPPPRYIEFRAPADRVPLVPAWRLPDVDEAFWSGRTVLIGATAPSLGDQMETPFGPLSGTEVMAEALAGVVADRTLVPLQGPAAWLMVLLWTLTSAAALGGARQAIAAAGSTVALLGAALLLAVVASGALKLWLPLAAMLLVPLFGGSLLVASLGWKEGQERAYLHQVLARRISPGLLRDILRSPGPLGTELGGRRCTCVVLFTDLVGFTPLSAQLRPPELFGLLNRYFEATAAAVIEEGGLLDKFIGDALMAEFGVPRSRGDGAEAMAAVRAAMSMQRRLEALNRTLAEQNMPLLRQGIGLHVGEVIAGNLGSPERLEFTVVGAAVNVASRLEGLTRQFPDHPILMSGALRTLLPAEVSTVDLGRHTLKGWPEPVHVHALSSVGQGGDAWQPDVGSGGS